MIASLFSSGVGFMVLILGLISLAIALLLLFYAFAIAAAILSALLRKFKIIGPPVDRTSREDAADTIDQFINGNGSVDWDWFCGTNYYSDELVQQVARECGEIYDTHPATTKGAYCNEAGFVRLRELRDLLISRKNEMQ